MKVSNSTLRAKQTLAAAQSALRDLGRSFAEVERAAGMIAKRKGDVVVTGLGKSGFVGQKFAASLTSLGTRAFYIHPVDALHGDLGRISKDDILVALSFSGETKEVVDIVTYVKKNFSVRVIALCRNADSSLGKISDCCVPIRVKSEGSPNNIAPMASTTATLVACDMIAASVVDSNFKDEHFAAYHPGGSLGLRFKKVAELMRKGVGMPNSGAPSTVRIAVTKSVSTCAPRKYPSAA